MPQSTSVNNLRSYMQDVQRLLQIHVELTGDEPGRRSGVEVLNKSAILLITAAWEAFVEDLAKESFTFLLTVANSHTIIPSKVQALAVESIFQEKDSTRLWGLADAGWKDILVTHKDASIERYAGSLNTPKYAKVDELFEALLGIRSISSSWFWKRQSIESSRDRLDRYITIRGQIAHRVVTQEPITKTYAKNFANFIYRLAVKTANKVRSFVHEQTGQYCWNEVTYEEIVIAEPD